MNKWLIGVLILVLVIGLILTVFTLTRSTSTRISDKGVVIHDAYLGNKIANAYLSGLPGTLVPANDITIKNVTITTSVASIQDRTVNLVYTYNGVNTAVAVESTTGEPIVTTESGSTGGIITLPAGKTSVTSSLIRRIKSSKPEMNLSVFVGSNGFDGIVCDIVYDINNPKV